MLTLDSFDPKIIGRNLRATRLMREVSQEELAQVTGISVKTISRIETGKGTTWSTLGKICRAFCLTPSQFLAMPGSAIGVNVDYGVHRRADEMWVYPHTPRKTKMPEDEFLRVQDPEERRRLGTLGIIPLFVNRMEFLMPAGPGMIEAELYSRLGGAFNSRFYRGGVVMCVGGSLRIGIAGQVVDLEEGDMMGHDPRFAEWMEPSPNMSEDELPVRLLWLGGARIGRMPKEFFSGKRVSHYKDKSGAGAPEST